MPHLRVPGRRARRSGWSTVWLPQWYPGPCPMSSADFLTEMLLRHPQQYILGVASPHWNSERRSQTRKIQGCSCGSNEAKTEDLAPDGAFARAWVCWSSGVLLVAITRAFQETRGSRWNYKFHAPSELDHGWVGSQARDGAQIVWWFSDVFPPSRRRVTTQVLQRGAPDDPARLKHGIIADPWHGVCVARLEGFLAIMWGKAPRRRRVTALPTPMLSGLRGGSCHRSSAWDPGCVLRDFCISPLRT